MSLASEKNLDFLNCEIHRLRCEISKLEGNASAMKKEAEENFGQVKMRRLQGLQNVNQNITVHLVPALLKARLSSDEFEKSVNLRKRANALSLIANDF